MRPPIQPIPAAAHTWLTRARYLRWLDTLVAWLAIVVVLAVAFDRWPSRVDALVAGVLVIVAAMPTPLRVRWRPVSGPVGLLASRTLRPGDRAWYVRGDRVNLVIVTARHGVRMSIAAPELTAAESLSVRRTRVFVVPVTAD
jgi:hypothetical protein